MPPSRRSVLASALLAPLALLDRPKPPRPNDSTLVVRGHRLTEDDWTQIIGHYMHAYGSYQ